MTRILSSSASLVLDGTTVPDFAEGTIRLDETTTFGVANITVPLAYAADLDPTADDIRGIITSAANGTGRTFNLGVREATINPSESTVTVRLATDEELVGDYHPLEDITTAFDHQDSLRAICLGVIQTVIPGAVLDAGPDVAFPVSWDSVNLFHNPNASLGAIDWNVHDASLTWNTSWFSTPPNSFLIYDPISVDGYMWKDLLALGAARDRTYTATGTAYVSTPLSGSSSAQRRSIVVAITTSTGPYFVQSDRAPNGGTERLSVTFRIPANALSAAIFFYHGHTAGNMWWDDLRLSEGDGIRDRDLGHLDGDRADDALYKYEWDDTAGLSVSRRTAFNPVPAETLVWGAGVSGWDFLLPITSAAGMRLFCDEQRVWHLVDAATYTVPLPTLVIHTNGASDAEDTITRDGFLWADGVIARYRWTDYFGGNQEKLDVAGSPGKVVVIDFARPYPGPGFAAAALTRRQSQGRSQTATVPTDLDATPGQDVSSTIEGIPEQLGRLSAVTFDVLTGYMDTTLRGLTAAP